MARISAPQVPCVSPRWVQSPHPHLRGPPRLQAPAPGLVRRPLRPRAPDRSTRQPAPGSTPRPATAIPARRRPPARIRRPARAGGAGRDRGEGKSRTCQEGAGAGRTVRESPGRKKAPRAPGEQAPPPAARSVRGPRDAGLRADLAAAPAAPAALSPPWRPPGFLPGLAGGRGPVSELPSYSGSMAVPGPPSHPERRGRPRPLPAAGGARYRSRQPLPPLGEQRSESVTRRTWAPSHDSAHVVLRGQRCLAAPIEV